MTEREAPRPRVEGVVNATGAIRRTVRGLICACGAVLPAGAGLDIRSIPHRDACPLGRAIAAAPVPIFLRQRLTRPEPGRGN